MNDCAADFGHAVMVAVAYRIAKLAYTGQAKEAERQYKAHCTALSSDAEAVFTQVMLAFAADFDRQASGVR